MKCSTCGAEHELLEPSFSRPDVIFAMAAEQKQGRVLESDDICALRGEGGAADRFFVRCTLSVDLLDVPGKTAWGLWAEVSEHDALIIRDAWDDPEQNKVPPMQARVANRIRGYPDTIGVPVLLRLTGPKSRPALSLPSDSLHPFARECLAGVCIHRVKDWLDGNASRAESVSET
jgi:hypothetical protein